MERRLVAVMITDIVGYTTLMGSDEAKALDMLSRNRNIHQSCFAKFNGSLIKEIGDGILASFPLASDAVRCAIEIQKASREANIPLKIGIHSGEIIFSGGDVLGDAVNIASRLQAEANENSIFISGSVNNDIKNKVEIKTEFIEEKTFKNVGEPVKVYKVIFDKVNEPINEEKQPRKINLRLAIAGFIFLLLSVSGIWYFTRSNKFLNLVTNKTLTVPSREKSIAVLPFYDDSPEKDNEYFCNGMMEEILTHLHNIADLRVKFRTDVMSYWEAGKGLKVLRSELKVAYVAEGSVRKAGEDLKITVQLINTKNGDHLWAESYDGKYTDNLFEFQSKIAKKIALSMNAAITDPEKHRIDRSRNTDIAAYDYILKSKEISNKFWATGDKSYISTIHFYADKALEIDHNSPLANLEKGWAFFMEAMKSEERVLARKKYDSAHFYADRAIKIDPDLTEALSLKAMVYRQAYDHSTEMHKAIEYFARAIELAPNHQQTLQEASYLYYNIPEGVPKGLVYMRKAIELSDENNPLFNFNKGVYYSFQEKYPEAIRYYLKALEHGVTHPSYHYIFRALSSQGKFAEAIQFLDTVLVGHMCGGCHSRYIRAYTELNKFELAEEHLNRLREEHYEFDALDSIRLGYIYLKTGREPEGMDMLKKMKEQHEQYFPVDNDVIHQLQNILFICCVLNEKKDALKYLSQLERSFILIGHWVHLGPTVLLDNIREEPEFKEIMLRVERKKQELKAQFVDLE